MPVFGPKGVSVARSPGRVTLSDGRGVYIEGRERGDMAPCVGVAMGRWRPYPL